MKKSLLVGALAFFGLATAQQEKGNFKLGAHIGLPVGELSEVTTFNVGVDVAYVYPIAENFKLGVTTGYSYYTGKTEEVNLYGLDFGKVRMPSLGIIPVAATAQLNLGSNVFVGVDLGYAFFTGKYAEAKTGAFYYQPKVGYTFNAKNDIYFSFKGMSVEGSSGNALNLGYSYNF